MKNEKKSSEKGNKVSNVRRVGGKAIEFCNILHGERKIFDALQVDERTFSQFLKEAVKNKPFALVQKYQFEVGELMIAEGKTFTERIIALWQKQNRETVSMKEFTDTIVLLRYFAYDCKPCSVIKDDIAVDMLSGENSINTINVITKECNMPGCIVHGSARKY